MQEENRSEANNAETVGFFSPELLRKNLSELESVVDDVRLGLDAAISGSLEDLKSNILSMKDVVSERVVSKVHIQFASELIKNTFVDTVSEVIDEIRDLAVRNLSDATEREIRVFREALNKFANEFGEILKKEQERVKQQLSSLTSN